MHPPLLESKSSSVIGGKKTIQNPIVVNIDVHSWRQWTAAPTQKRRDTIAYTSIAYTIIRFTGRSKSPVWHLTLVKHSKADRIIPERTPTQRC